MMHGAAPAAARSPSPWGCSSPRGAGPPRTPARWRPPPRGGRVQAPRVQRRSSRPVTSAPPSMWPTPCAPSRGGACAGRQWFLWRAPLHAGHESEFFLPQTKPSPRRVHGGHNNGFRVRGGRERAQGRGPGGQGGMPEWMFCYPKSTNFLPFRANRQGSVLRRVRNDFSAICILGIAPFSVSTEISPPLGPAWSFSL